MFFSSEKKGKKKNAFALFRPLLCPTFVVYLSTEKGEREKCPPSALSSGKGVIEAICPGAGRPTVLAQKKNIPKSLQENFSKGILFLAFKLG